MKKEKILIIGGCGYIGSALFQHLIKKRYIVDTVDLEWFGNYVNPKNIVADYKDLKKEFFLRYDVVILLAGHSSVQMCKGNPLSVLKNNVENFILLLNKLSNNKFIYASSSSVYGNTKKIQASERYSRYTPKNYYDLTKKEIDYYSNLSTIQYYGLRFGTVNGYSPNLRVDLMINKMYDVARKTGELRLSNPGTFRPILGIDDLCRAVLAIIEQNGTVGIYNLASFNASIEEIGKEFKKKIKKIKIIEHVSPIEYDFSINTKKFEQAFDFQFKDTVKSIITSLHKGYERAERSIRVKII